MSFRTTTDQIYIETHYLDHLSLITLTIPTLGHLTLTIATLSHLTLTIPTLSHLTLTILTITTEQRHMKKQRTRTTTDYVNIETLGPYHHLNHITI
jgi:hypothetical protein